MLWRSFGPELLKRPSNFVVRSLTKVKKMKYWFLLNSTISRFLCIVKRYSQTIKHLEIWLSEYISFARKKLIYVEQNAKLMGQDFDLKLKTGMDRNWCLEDEKRYDVEKIFEKQFIACNTYPNNPMLFNFSEQFIAYLLQNYFVFYHFSQPLLEWSKRRRLPSIQFKTISFHPMWILWKFEFKFWFSKITSCVLFITFKCRIEWVFFSEMVSLCLLYTTMTLLPWLRDARNFRPPKIYKVFVPKDTLHKKTPLLHYLFYLNNS